MVELLRGGTRPVVRVRGHEQPHPDSAARGALDAPDHAPVGDVGIDHVERRAGAVEYARDRVGDRPVATGALCRTTAGIRSPSSCSGNRASSSAAGTEPPSQRKPARKVSCNWATTGPATRTNRSWKRPSSKWSSIPAPPTQPILPSTTITLRWSMCPSPRSSSARRRPRRACPRGAELGRAHHADLDPGRGEAVVELQRATLGIRALAVDDEPDRDAVLRLGDEDLGEPVSHEAGTEAELVDVDRGRRRGDVLEHRRVERRPPPAPRRTRRGSPRTRSTARRSTRGCRADAPRARGSGGWQRSSASSSSSLVVRHSTQTGESARTRAYWLT